MSTKESNRRYYLAHREEHIAKSRAYYEKHRDHLSKLASERQKRFRKLFPEKARRQQSKSYYKNRDKKAAYAKEYNQRNRRILLQELGNGKCAWCGYSDFRALEIDHVNGDGAEDRKKHNFHAPFTVKQMKRVLENKERFQILCCNCNRIKRYENKENPPRKEAPDFSKLEA